MVDLGTFSAMGANWARLLKHSEPVPTNKERNNLMIGSRGIRFRAPQGCTLGNVPFLGLGRAVVDGTTIG